MRFACVWAMVLGIAQMACALPRESVTFTDVNSNGALGNSANTILTNEFTGTYSVQRLNITATLQSLAAATQPREARIQIIRPNGGSTVIAQPFTSSSSFGTLSVTMSITVNPAQAAGLWQFRFYESFDDGGVNVVDARWTSIQVELDDSLGPPLIDLGDIGSAADIHQNLNISAGEVRWVRFTIGLPASSDAQRYLDLDTEGTTISSSDTVMALYDSLGNKIVEDNDDGSNFLSALSFGLTNFVRPAPGNGIPGNSRDGTLEPGEYFLAIGGFPMTCNATNFDATSASNANGSLTMNIKGGRYCRADYNNDGVIDFFDYLDFVQEFSSGCGD